MTADLFVQHRYANASGSPIRELKRYTELPGMISLAGGYPAAELMDAQGLQDLARHMRAEDFSQSLEYGGTDGSMPLRAELARVSQTRQLSASAEDVLVLSGSQQGIDLLARTLITPGDGVLVESPTYPAALSAFRFAGATLHQVPTDAEGLDVDALESILRSHRIKCLYTVPTFSNPTGRTLSASRRRRVAELAVQYQCLVIEDDPYGSLHFGEEAETPIHAQGRTVAGAGELLVYLSSLSKTLAPGLRIGWMLAPPAIRRACVLAKQVDDMHASTLTQALAAAYLASGAFEARLPTLRNAYRQRAQALVDAVRDHLGHRLHMAEPSGGMFAWARAPGVDATQWLRAAIEAQVMFVPGSAFFAADPDPASLRLSFASQDEAGIREGVRRLAQALARIA